MSGNEAEISLSHSESPMRHFVVFQLPHRQQQPGKDLSACTVGK